MTMDALLTQAHNVGDQWPRPRLHPLSEVLHMHASRPLMHLPMATPWPLDGMGSTPVDARVYRARDWSVVQIDGELDIQGVVTVRPLLTGEGQLIVFDLERVTFMDCCGLGLLAGVASAASERGGCVRVAGASRQVRKLLTLGLPDGAVSLFDSLDDALTVPVTSGTERPKRGRRLGWSAGAEPADRRRVQ